MSGSGPGAWTGGEAEQSAETEGALREATSPPVVGAVSEQAVALSDHALPQAKRIRNQGAADATATIDGFTWMPACIVSVPRYRIH